MSPQEEYFEEERERAPQSGGIRSLPAKVIVPLLTVVCTGIMVFSIWQLVLMMESCVSPEDLLADRPYEETTYFADQIIAHMVNVRTYYQTAGALDSNYGYDPEQTLNFWEYAGNTPSKMMDDRSLTYTMGELASSWSADILRSTVNDGYEQFATNDAGLDRMAYSEGDYYYYDEPYITEREVDQAETAQIVPNNEVFYPSDETRERLERQGYDPDAYSSLFLYLYECGYSYLEPTCSQGGTYLYEIAADHPGEISLADLYMALADTIDDINAFRETAAVTHVGESNIWFFLQSGDYTKYSNVESWRGNYDQVIGMIPEGAFAIALERTGSSVRYGLLPEGDSSAMSELKRFLESHTILSETEQLVIMVDPDYAARDTLQALHGLYEAWYPAVPFLIAGAVGGTLFVLAGIVLITLQAGRRQTGGEVRLYRIDRIPTEPAIVLWGFVLVLGMVVPGLVFSLACDTGRRWITYSDGYSYYWDLSPWRAFAVAASFAFYVALCIPVYCGLVRRWKGKTLWKNSFACWLFRRFRGLCKEISSSWKATHRVLLLFIIFALLQLFLCFGGLGIVITAVIDLAVALLLIREAAGRQSIRDGLQQIGSGDLSYKIDTERLAGANREMAESVNRVGDGLQAAVQEQMKSERLKADLITNVSHDIKTPLTSIINYVDLLKRENIQDPKIQGYIEILDSKSQRLKHLAEDLVEASKVSSGNISLEFMNLNLNELVQQVNGEFASRFEERGLDLICVLQPEPLLIRADGRRIWRVLENLYVNVAKYAMPRTRVYVDAVRKDGRVVFSIKNISENPLNINADELTERFIRGDVSRSTEGSGLGLSIAKNLTILQHGTFDIYLDGDLFKVTITFFEASAAEPFWAEEQGQTAEKKPDAVPLAAGTV